MGAKSETDYSNLNVDPRAKSDSSLLYLVSKPANSNGFSPGTIRISSKLTTDYLNDSNKSNNYVVNNA